MFEKSLTAIIKITNNCNLGCKYCYTPDSAYFGDMSYEILEKIICGIPAVIENTIPEKRHFTFLWHGGEPLSRGIDFFKKIHDFQCTHLSGIKYVNLIQSNLTLLNEEMVSFFKETGFRIGTSIDGPKELHNANRVYKSGKGTSDTVFKNLALAKAGGLDISALLVLNKQNISSIKLIYDFFLEQKIDIKIGSLTISGQAVHNLDHVAITTDDYANAIIELFDMWFEDSNESSHFLNLEDIVDTILQRKGIECTHLVNCQNHFFSISPKGDVYPCGRFDGVPKLCYGNVTNSSLVNVLLSKKRQQLIEVLNTPLDECKKCEWLDICNGGCMHHSFDGENVNQRKDYYCSAYKKIFNHISSKLKLEINNSLKGES